MGDLLPRVVWPSDVAAYVTRVDIQMQATDAAVSQCTGLSSAEVSAWRDFFRAWQDFKADASCVFGCAGKFDDTKGYEDRLHAWQTDTIGPKCRLVGPQVTPTPGVDPAFKWLAAAAIVGVVGYIAGPSIRSFLPVKRR